MVRYMPALIEPEAKVFHDYLQSAASMSWDYNIVIPAQAESAWLPHFYESLVNVTSHACLWILVLNNSIDATTDYADNQKLLLWLEQHICQQTVLSTAPTIRLAQLRSGISLLLIERCQGVYAFPQKQGVGLARKIGMDCALAAWHLDRMGSDYIHTCDADACLPEGYFTAPQGHTYIYPFRHIPGIDDLTWQALVQYELWLRYYFWGLHSAGSPYAYDAVGSLIACRFEVYEAVRGMPKRKAGEDFYFLNKLAKQGQLVQGRGQPVILHCRESKRVPFGTGQGTIKIKDLIEAGRSYEVYHPKVFLALAQLIDSVEAWQEAGCFEMTLESRFKALGIEFELLRSWRWQHHWDLAQQRSRDPRGRVRAFHDWFDSFKTLKLIHQLRDQAFGTLPLEQALSEADFLPIKFCLGDNFEDYLVKIRDFSS